jgi:methylated-DNA-[protein]-cysteine S-methyltransferase
MRRYRTIETPGGPFAIVQDDDGALQSTWVGQDPSKRLGNAVEDMTLLADIITRLESYFAGALVAFDDVPVPAGPAFHRACWSACRAIPRGQTRTYGQLADLAGSPRAARAAGQAMRSNPLPVIVPCHRVVASHGRIGGFGGSQDLDGPLLSLKRILLEIEGAEHDRTAELFEGVRP